MKERFKKIGRFFHEVKVELKKVNWPTGKELSQYTGIVLLVILVVGTFFYFLDTGFTQALKLVIR